MAEVVIRTVVDLGSESMQILRELRDRLPEPSAPADQVPTGLRPLLAATAPKGSALADAKRRALQAVMDALDGWIEGAQSNHEALGHRGEPRGYECWRHFSPGDIRNMINDACREVGVAEFPYPNVPEEDTV